MRFGLMDTTTGPTILMWGDGLDLRELAALLRMFAANVDRLALCDAGFTSQTGHQITIQLAHGAPGMQMSGSSEQLDWLISPAAALRFANLVEHLASQAKGHQYLDGEHGHTVMVSLNEYPADFLVR